jgi:hypothetical protein
MRCRNWAHLFRVGDDLGVKIHNFLIVWAILVGAIVLIAICVDHSNWNVGHGSTWETNGGPRRDREAYPSQMFAHFRDVRLSRWENVAIDYPSPKVDISIISSEWPRDSRSE